MISLRITYIQDILPLEWWASWVWCGNDRTRPDLVLGERPKTGGGGHFQRIQPVNTSGLDHLPVPVTKGEGLVY